MTSEALEAIREYYPDADVKPVRFRGERIGYGVFLSPDDEPIGFASDKRTGAKRARDYLIQGGSLPDSTEQ